MRQTSSAYEADFKFNARLEPGSVYYVRFYGDGVGNYKFKISANNDEYPNSHDLAKKIDINKEYSTAFNGVKDDDYVKFTTAAYSAYYHVEYTYVGFKGRAYAYLYDAEGNEINSSSYYEGSFSFAEKLEPNTEYVVRFYGDGVGNYKFKIRAAKDADGDTMESATKLSLNQKYQTSFESKTDVDWFKVELSQPVNLLVSLYCESVKGGYFEVYNERNANLASQGYISNGSTGSRSVQVDAGTYYIKAHCAAAGYYTIAVSPCGGGHTEVTDYGKLATCTSPGLTEGKHCSLCGTVIKKQTTVNAKGHKFSKGSCTVCGAKDPNYVPTFTDVKPGVWYKKAVDHVAKHGLVSGMSATTFGPDTKVSRAMFVTIIARMAGVDTSSAANKAARTPFGDVPSGKYYSAAVAWGSKTGIVAGTSKSAFSPDANITREQLCSLIVRYAEYHGIDIKSKKAEMKFADAGSISNYAKAAVKKCQMAGIVSGYNDGTFGPKGNAKRSEAAQILYVFHSDYVLK